MGVLGHITLAEWAAMQNARRRKRRAAGDEPVVQPMVLTFTTGNYLPAANIQFRSDWFQPSDFSVDWGDSTGALFEWDGSGWALNGDEPPAESGTGTLTQAFDSIPFNWSGGEPEE